MHRDVRPLLPPDPVAVQCTFFDKSPARNWLVAAHQDLSIPVSRRIDSPAYTGWSRKEGVLYVQPPPAVLERLAAVRVHLDASTPDNGPLRVVPGSHRLGRLSAEEIEIARQRDGEITCLVERGGALVMHPLLIHASSKVSAPAPRRVLHFVYGPARLPDGLDWHDAS
jgi:ectoine hydroxylase-related dioxygenase (phytanoyl-CoA dioxygenase family)